MQSEVMRPKCRPWVSLSALLVSVARARSQGCSLGGAKSDTFVGGRGGNRCKCAGPHHLIEGGLLEEMLRQVCIGACFRGAAEFSAVISQMHSLRMHRVVPSRGLNLGLGFRVARASASRAGWLARVRLCALK